MPDPSSIRALLVDDDPMLLDAVQALLERATTVWHPVQHRMTHSPADQCLDRSRRKWIAGVKRGFESRRSRSLPLPLRPNWSRKECLSRRDRDDACLVDGDLLER